MRRIIDHITRRRDRVVAIGDQALVGLSNFLALAAFARLLPRDDFAAIGVAIAVHYVIFGFHRAAIVMPYILSAKDRPDPLPRSAWAFLAMRASLGAGLILFVAALALGLSGVSGFATKCALFAALQSPALLLQEFAKRWLYQHERPIAVLVSSGSGFAIVLAGIALVATALPVAMLASAMLGLAALVAAGIAFLLCRPSRDGLGVPAATLIGRRRDFTLWQSIAHIPYILYNNGYTLLLAIFTGPGAAAGYTALRTLLSPSVSLISAIDSTDKLRAIAAFHADGAPGAKRSADRTRRLLLMLNGPFLLAAAIFAGPYQHLVLGPAYHHPVEMAVLAGYCLLLSVNQPFETFLVVQEQARTLLFSRCLSAVLAIAGLALLGPMLGLLGAAIALLVAQSCNLVALWWLSRRQLRHAPLRAVTI
ncbi:polysaccharide biosynthesis C-terminal domain-containing protein [Rhizorhabdus sp.]|uniref:polysaccharide biosynthesis C-terminal domain-containing protein n=1 Tax=Rhizorhabdus sp. TaxID=1968843 RepID=UPI0019C97FF5|nr:polysaccharide biosynthesis C-terminal domain-containing protein [Rhizorhabdus sp.]MBD3762408.1 polysaccharide biosynthesis C-terminal domain-containing protein [Rhizorhabdus sp.]